MAIKFSQNDEILLQITLITIKYQQKHWKYHRKQQQE